MADFHLGQVNAPLEANAIFTMQNDVAHEKEPTDVNNCDRASNSAHPMDDSGVNNPVDSGAHHPGPLYSPDHAQSHAIEEPAFYHNMRERIPSPYGTPTKSPLDIPMNLFDSLESGNSTPTHAIVSLSGPHDESASTLQEIQVDESSSPQKSTQQPPADVLPSTQIPEPRPLGASPSPRPGPPASFIPIFNPGSSAVHSPRPFIPPIPPSLHNSTPRHNPAHLPNQREQKEGYIAGNPFQSSIPRVSAEALPSVAQPSPHTNGASTHKQSFNAKSFGNDLAIKLDNGLRQIYHSIFLRIPMFYFTRVTRIFKEARLSADDLTKKVIDSLVVQQTPGQRLHANAYFVDINDSRVSSLKTLWESFIDALMREWKTINIISVLLLSAIIGTLQIDAAFSDPLVRNTALMSLICALMSLLYGGMYIIRFTSMRRVHKAVEWAREGESTSTAIFWNVWVLLAMPAIWLSWSLILYVISIMTFVWRVDSNSQNATGISPRAELGARIAISCILFLGLVYLALIISTLKRYGEQMDNAWKKKIQLEAVKRNVNVRFTPPQAQVHNFAQISTSYSAQWPENEEVHSIQQYPQYTGPWGFPVPENYPVTFHQALEVVQFSASGPEAFQMPRTIRTRGIHDHIWRGFTHHLSLAWNGPTPSGSITRTDFERQEDLLEVVNIWNTTSFSQFNFEAHLCRTYRIEASQILFAVYLTDHNTEAPSTAVRFGPIPQGLRKIDIYELHSDAPLLVTSLFAPGFHPSGHPYHAKEIPITPKDGDSQSGESDQSSIVDFSVQSPSTASPMTPTTGQQSPQTFNHFGSMVHATRDETSLTHVLPFAKLSTDVKREGSNAIRDGATAVATLPKATDMTKADADDSDQAEIQIVETSTVHVPSDFRLSAPKPRVKFSPVTREIGLPDEDSAQRPRHREIPKPTSVIVKNKMSPSDPGVRYVHDAGPSIQTVQSWDHERTPKQKLESLPELLLHGVLRYRPNNPHVVYSDLRMNPGDSGCRPCPEAELISSATTPTTHELVLHSPVLPYPMKIRPGVPGGVTVYDVISNLWEQLNEIVSSSELERLSKSKLGEVMETQQARLALLEEIPGLKVQWKDGLTAVRKVDFLHSDVAFEGLVETGDGIWEVKTGKKREYVSIPDRLNRVPRASGSASS
ncbi:hypothetical protein Hypma_002758 [Hypsizygus marmoreus]|uniref:DUF6699 domain-containing protein n=1 Tax=Hypsizygus marmoreus TaxID=39966 RepID=A0A369J759_HYPMA|nr:hypothetical protein Hypma_002758 [Hypsizygus marmoreus]